MPTARSNTILLLMQNLPPASHHHHVSFFSSVKLHILYIHLFPPHYPVKKQLVSENVLLNDVQKSLKVFDSVLYNPYLTHNPELPVITLRYFKLLFSAFSFLISCILCEKY